MKHYGDITKINGVAVEPVDVIIGGSPCQDLSVAGKRAGLDGSRSGLFMEQIRIIKEMRENARSTNRPIRPRYMVWENVPGAFSSNKSEDFRIVLEETARIADETAVIPRPPKDKWQTAGCTVGDGWSIAWRVLDAQFWGVPQRRRRIALVADFGGQSAGEILFERESVSGDIAESGAQGEGVAGGAKGGVVETISFTTEITPKIDEKGIAFSIRSRDYKDPPCICIQGNCIDRADTAGCNGGGWTEDVSYTLNTVDRPAVFGFCAGASSTAGSIGYQEDVSPTLKGAASGTAQVPAVICYAIGNGQADNTNCHDVAGALNCMHDQQAVVISDSAGDIAQDKSISLRARDYKTPPLVAAVDCRNYTENPDTNGTLQAKSTGGTSLNLQNVVRYNTFVRRLTSLECERLQGFPDGWTDIGDWRDTKGKKRKTTDSNRYKALGNSIALPSWHWLLNRLSQQFTYTPTMASLFDGIGGFPLIWEWLNGKGTAIWASEIDEFSIAVTKLRFPGGTP